MTREGKTFPRFALKVDATFDFYHTHIYFTPTQVELAQRFRETLSKQKYFRVSPLVDHPIGPHPLPMFEADFKGAHLHEALKFLAAERGELSVLVHPLSGNEILDHTTYAWFLGLKQNLLLDIFK